MAINKFFGPCFGCLTGILFQFLMWISYKNVEKNANGEGEAKEFSEINSDSIHFLKKKNRDLQNLPNVIPHTNKLPSAPSSPKYYCLRKSENPIVYSLYSLHGRSCFVFVFVFVILFFYAAIRCMDTMNGWISPQTTHYIEMIYSCTAEYDGRKWFCVRTMAYLTGLHVIPLPIDT